MKTKKIEILRSTVCDLKRVGPGEVLEISAESARFLCAIGKAKPYVAPKEKPAPKKKPILKLKKESNV